LEKYESINVYGNSNKPKHPHYASQLPLYVKMGLKNAILDNTVLRAQGVHTYHPER